MKLIYSQGFSKSERLDWKPVVFSNIIQSFRTIHEAMTELHYEFDNPDNEVSFRAALPSFPDTFNTVARARRRMRKQLQSHNN